MNDNGVGISIPHNDQPAEVPNEAPASLDLSDSMMEVQNEEAQPIIDAQDATETESAAVMSSDAPEENAAPESAPLAPDIAAKANESTPSRISNNPFNSRAHYQPTATKADGDIPQFFNDAIMASAPIKQPRRHNKKLFLFAGVAAGVIALVAVILLIIVPLISNGITGQKVSANNREIRAVFVKYANFILNGKESDDDIGEYDVNKMYYINTIYRKEDARELAAFYREANDKYAKVKEKVNELYERDDEHRTQIDDYSAYLSLSYSNAIRGDYSERELAKTFIADGEEAAMQKVKDFYTAYETEDYSSTYIGDAIEYYNSLIDMLKFYVSNNCDSSNDILSGACYERFSDDATLKRIVSAKNEALEQRRAVMMLANKNVCAQLWSVYEQIKE